MLALALVNGCLAEQFAAPLATIPSPRVSRLEIYEQRPLTGQVGWIVDGVGYRWPGDSARLAKLEVDDIESIGIIRAPAVSQLYPAFRCSAVIVVTMKRSIRERRAGAVRRALNCVISPFSNQPGRDLWR